MKWLAAFGRFWWDFVVGDDWRVAALVAIAVGATAALAHSGITTWWLMPVAAVLILWLSLRRAIRSG
jgi:apolipoprotein N-acyltransferase